MNFISIKINWLLTPVQFDPITHFDAAVHRIDDKAKIYLLKADSDVRGMIPVKTLGDGNCLYNSVACLAGNKIITPSELRGMYYITTV